ncbi:MAG TPA: hypothetical protein VKX49_29415 [Bryobacteraceae bacterium]|nr:hypothetical protein [Bryobacteraceae bacterium]
MPCKLLGIALTGTACALALFAADSWKNRDYTQWTDDDINKILTDSPWAKEQTVTPQRPNYGGRGGGGGMGRRGGIGFPGGGYPGGYPGGGYPGGGYPGGGYPGGGGRYPRGGGYPDDTGGGYPNTAPMNVTIRWDSALPVQQALQRQGAASAEEAKAVAEASEKYYVVSVFGFRMPANRRNRYGAGNPDSDDDQDRTHTSADALRSQLLDAAQLVPKGGRAIYAQDVQVESLGSEIHFLFPRTPPIAPSAKEVDFILEVRGLKLQHKFHLPDMQYQGQLAL